MTRHIMTWNGRQLGFVTLRPGPLPGFLSRKRYFWGGPGEREPKISDSQARFPDGGFVYNFFPGCMFICKCAVVCVRVAELQGGAVAGDRWLDLRAVSRRGSGLLWLIRRLLLASEGLFRLNVALINDATGQFHNVAEAFRIWFCLLSCPLLSARGWPGNTRFHDMAAYQADVFGDTDRAR